MRRETARRDPATPSASRRSSSPSVSMWKMPACCSSTMNRVLSPDFASRFTHEDDLEPAVVEAVGAGVELDLELRPPFRGEHSGRSRRFER